MEISNYKIQFDGNGRRHGYYQETIAKRHYYNGLKIGYEEYNGNIYYKWRCHYINNQEIGYEKINNLQLLHNKPGQKFGEVITWK